MSNLAYALQIPVILVVGMKLGCLNHAILTAQAITQPKIPLAGWIANCPSPTTMTAFKENIQTLKRWIPSRCLGVVKFNQNQTLTDICDALENYPS